MYEARDFGIDTRGATAAMEIAPSTGGAHPLAHIRALVDDLCDGADATAARWSTLIRAALLQALYSFQSDEQLLEQLRYNALYRWFVGLRDDDALWSESSYSQQLGALRASVSASPLFRRAVSEAHAYAALVPGRFRVDTTLVETWTRSQSLVAGAGRPEGLHSDMPRPSRLERARAVILRRVGDPTLDADAVAAELCMSRRALYLLFERYGLTPTRAIREIRLDCCLRLLRDERHCHRKITDIAMDHGFQHFASFSRQFKLRYGISPSAVRSERQLAARMKRGLGGNRDAVATH